MVMARVRWLWLFALALVAATVFPAAARAGDKSFIIVITTGDELRYTYTARNEETTGVTGHPGVGAQGVTTETVGILFRCKADTRAQKIIDVVYESFVVTVESSTGRVSVDLSGPAPAPDAPEMARQVYASLHGIVGTVVTLNTAPGSGEITLFHGNDELVKRPGAAMLRRYLDRDYFAANFGQVFQLKPNSAAPPPGQDWWVQRAVFAFAHGGKTAVWETRTVDNTLADIATIKGKTRATGNPQDSDKASVFFKSITGDCVYTWDFFRSRLVSATRTEVINSRYTANGILRESDVITKSTLEAVKPAAPTTERPADQVKPAPSSPGDAPKPAGPAKGAP